MSNVTPPVSELKRPAHMSDEEWRAFLEDFRSEWRGAPNGR